jgi:hypothetical protein
MIYKPNTGLSSTSIPVTIWNNSTHMPLAPPTSVLMTDPTFTTPLGNTYYFHALSTPLRLVAGQEYVIGGYYASSQDFAKALGSSIVTNPRVTYNGPRAIMGNAFPPTNQGSYSSNSYLGPRVGTEARYSSGRGEVCMGQFVISLYLDSAAWPEFGRVSHPSASSTCTLKGPLLTSPPA